MKVYIKYMKPIIFMFYYINAAHCSREHAEENLYRISRQTKIEMSDCEIIQQYFSIDTGVTRVEVVSVPEIKVENSDVALKIHKNIEKIIGHFESLTPINSISDIYG